MRIRKSGVGRLRAGRLLLGLALLPPALALFAALSFLRCRARQPQSYLSRRRHRRFSPHPLLCAVALFAGWLIVKAAPAGALMAVGLPPVFFALRSARGDIGRHGKADSPRPGRVRHKLAVLLLGGGAVVERAQTEKLGRCLFGFRLGSAADIADTTVFDAVTPVKDG